MDKTASLNEPSMVDPFIQLCAEYWFDHRGCSGSISGRGSTRAWLQSDGCRQLNAGRLSLFGFLGVGSRPGRHALVGPPDDDRQDCALSETLNPLTGTAARF